MLEMNKPVATLVASCIALYSAQARQNVLGLNFIITKPTPVNVIAARDGGTEFDFTESVAIFNDLTGSEVGPEAIFGPGANGTQVGDAFYERVPTFVLEPGDYSLIAISDGPPFSGGGGGLIGGDGFKSLGGDINLPEGDRFNFGTGFDSGSTGPRGQLQPFFFIDEVPDASSTLVLFGGALAGLAWARRRF